MESFEQAVDAVVDGDLVALKRLLEAEPELVRARSEREHRATLLHYVAANGVEDDRQRTPTNAVAIAETLLAAGSEPDALAETYGGGTAQTPLALLVSSCHPMNAGLMGPLVETLCRGGAKVDGLEQDGVPLATALAFFYPEAVAALGRCGARPLNLVYAAALGDMEAVRRFLSADDPMPGPLPGVYWVHLSSAPELARQQALVSACMCGRREVAELLLDAGVEINAGPHRGQTALHLAAWTGQAVLVRWLLERGADRSVRDSEWRSTPAGWAAHAGRAEIAALLGQ